MQSGVPRQLLQQVQHLRADSAMRGIGSINRRCLVETTVDACVTTASVKLGGNRQLQSTLNAPSAVRCHTSRRSAAYKGLYLKEKRKLVELEHVHGMECEAHQAQMQEVKQRADQLSARWQARCERQTQAAEAQKRTASEHRLLAAQHKQRADQVAAAQQDTQMKLHGSEETCAALQEELDAVRHEFADAQLELQHFAAEPQASLDKLQLELAAGKAENAQLREQVAELGACAHAACGV